MAGYKITKKEGILSKSHSNIVKDYKEKFNLSTKKISVIRFFSMFSKNKFQF